MKYSIAKDNQGNLMLFEEGHEAAIREPVDSELEFWARIQELELEYESSMEAAISLLEDRPMKEGGFAHLLFCNGGNHERIGDGTSICNCPLGKRIKGFKKKIRELEITLTEIFTRTLRPSKREGGAAQIVLSAEQMAEIAEKALIK